MKEWCHFLLSHAAAELFGSFPQLLVEVRTKGQEGARLALLNAVHWDDALMTFPLHREACSRGKERA